MRRMWICLGVALLGLAAPAAAHAGFADLDSSFGSGGINLTDLGGYDSARAVAIDPAGRFVAAGSGTLNDSSRPNGTALTVVRLLPSGHYDTSFGGDGIVQTDPGRYTAAFESVGVDGQGRIVAVGTATAFDGAGSNLVVARYLDDGSPDPSFGTNGLVTLGGAGIWFGVDSLIEGDRMLVLALTDGGGVRPTLLRLNEDGSVDQTYGTGGALRLQTNKLATATSMAPSGDGVIVAGANARRSMAAVRVSSDGAVDRTWAQNGFAAVKFPGSSEAAAVTRDFGGRAILAGSCSCKRGASAAVARLRAGGKLDKNFDGAGRRTFRLGGKRSGSEAVSETTINGENPLLGVVVSNGGDRRSSLVQLTSKGAFDRRFSEDGVTSPGYGAGFGGDLVGDIAEDGHGGIVAADTLFGATPDFVVARFTR